MRIVSARAAKLPASEDWRLAAPDGGAEEDEDEDDDMVHMSYAQWACLPSTYRNKVRFLFLFLVYYFSDFMTDFLFRFV